MKDELVTFQTAKLAKEKGFTFSDEQLEYAYGNGLNSYFMWHDGSHWACFSHFEFDTTQHGYVDTDSIPAPQQSDLQRWLREKHNLLLIALPWRDHQCDVNDPYTFRPMIVGVKTWVEYKTYEEALEVGLQEALKLLP